MPPFTEKQEGVQNQGKDTKKKPRPGSALQKDRSSAESRMSLSILSEEEGEALKGSIEEKN